MRTSRVVLRNLVVLQLEQAFWVSSQAIKLQCLPQRKGKAQQPVLPSIISMHVAELPDNSSIPEPAPMQVCFRCPPSANETGRKFSAVHLGVGLGFEVWPLCG